MMKKIYLLLTILFVPLFNQAQQYNHTYNFFNDHFRSDHLCAVQVTEKFLVVGSTLDGPIQGRNLQLNYVHSTFGTTFPTTYSYAVGNFLTRAVDLVQSSFDKKYVVTTNNYLPYPGGPTHIGINVVKVKPDDGTIAWAKHFGKSDANFEAKAIARNDAKGIYYVLGDRWTDVPPSEYTNQIYLLAINDAGNILWERLYNLDEKDSRSGGRDLLYNPRTDVVVITGFVSGGHVAGSVIAEIDPANGNVVKSALIPKVGGFKEFSIRDITMANNRYVLVGEIFKYPLPRRGILLQINPGLTPYTSYSQIFTAGEENIALKGIRSNVQGNLYAAFEYRDHKEPLFTQPGLIEMDRDGNLMSSYLYEVEKYDGVSGLLDVFGGELMVIKGATKPGTYGVPNPSLSLVSVKTPLTDEPEICAKRIELDKYQGAEFKELVLKDTRIETVKNTTVVVREVNVEASDCRREKARLASNELSGSEEEANVNLYPNPSDGKINIVLNEAARLQFNKLEIFNALGKVVFVSNSVAPFELVDLSDQAPGIYVLRLQSPDGNVMRNERFILR